MEVVRSGQDVPLKEKDQVKASNPKGPKRHLIRAKAVDVGDLNHLQLKRMYQVFSKYYADHPESQFLQDLMEKSVVILLIDKINGAIQGFSTILKFESKVGKQKYTGLYSGDTVLEEEYWGSPALGKAFLKYLWLQKVRFPFRPVYWFLISKGYKTYLLMANNFSEHYPRFEKVTPSKQRNLMNNFYSSKFPTSFFPEKGLIIPDKTSCRLKENIACIKKELLKNPRVHFFQTSNPNWMQGHELCCIAKMTYLMPVKYALKKMMGKRA